MSIIETTAVAPAKPKRHARPNRRKPVKAAPKADGEFAGLTAKNCPTACNASRCVISGIDVCAHPLKAGLQAAQKHDPKVLARFARAKEALE